MFFVVSTCTNSPNRAFSIIIIPLLSPFHPFLALDLFLFTSIMPAYLTLEHLSGTVYSVHSMYVCIIILIVDLNQSLLFSKYHIRLDLSSFATHCGARLTSAWSS
ncbi:hypothetical protein F5879DRAFT_170473 [Lentinula edodes]|uniref:uncharacterized protein n=1 Tax=Lentinula edodes TaxID=5353 RepID=UPI001E8ED9AD|nr:uncharacterized protein C8R40DRAFT_885799 [Lentinula edodes]KAH7867972.1 hypothetical protein C8R40DRAFT_885799 [Lentinula edodes]KAJ3909085.1 hypothetical protein F5879DRAFT_170473 [Lentinula edodes]